MNRLVFSIMFLLLTVSFSVFGQSSKPTVQDTIIRLGGKKIACDVMNVSATDVTYKLLGETKSRVIERKQIEKIRYKSGNLDIFNKPVLQMLGDSQWESVLVTEKKSDVEGLFEYATIEAISTSDARSPKSARKSATIRLQKKAANIGANIILLIKAEAKGGYGEIPGYDLVGIAYGFEKPSEEVQKKIDEINQENKKK